MPVVQFPVFVAEAIIKKIKAKPSVYPKFD
jgi:hypothetical protein